MGSRRPSSGPHDDRAQLPVGVPTRDGMGGRAAAGRLERADRHRPCRVRAPARRAGTGAALSAVGLGSVAELRGMYTAGRDELERYAGDGPLLTDDRPRLEFWRSDASGRDLTPELSRLHGDPDEVVLPDAG